MHVAASTHLEAASVAAFDDLVDNRLGLAPALLVSLVSCGDADRWLTCEAWAKTARVVPCIARALAIARLLQEARLRERVTRGLGSTVADSEMGCAVLRRQA